MSQHTCFVKSALLEGFSTVVISKPCVRPGPETYSYEAAVENKSCFEYKTKTFPIKYTHGSRVQNQHKLMQSRRLQSKQDLHKEQSPVHQEGLHISSPHATSQGEINLQWQSAGV